MKNLFYLTILILAIGFLRGDGNVEEEFMFNLGDRVRNCPAMSTEREGPSSTIYVATFGLEPDFLEGDPEGIPSTFWKINYINGALGVTSIYSEIVFDDTTYSYLKAYDHDDSTYINSHFSIPENSYRLDGQKGFWASPVLNEEYDLVYLLTKSGMLFTVDVETMEVDDTAGHYHNLREMEENAGASISINNYEYLATPLLCRDTSGDYLIIPGIWNVFYVPLSSGLLTTTPDIIANMTLDDTSDCFMSPAAMDYESSPNLLIVSKKGKLFRKIGATVYYEDEIPNNPTKCYFQPTISEDGHFYINTEAAIYSVPVNGRTAEGAWVYDFDIELVDNITGIENIDVAGMEKEMIVTRNDDDYDKLYPDYEDTVPVDCEDIINYDNDPYHTGSFFYRLMNNHSIFIQKNIDEYCIFSINNIISDSTGSLYNENYYHGILPPNSYIYWEFINADEPNPQQTNYDYGTFQFEDLTHISYGAPAAYYTIEDRLNLIVGDEQGCLWSWRRSVSENQLGFSPLYYNSEGYVPLYPEYGYSKFMDTPPNVIEFSTIDSINIHYQCEQETDYSIYLNSYAREAVTDTFATANFERLMKHPKYTLSVFDSDTLVYRNDNFRLLDENIHDYYIIGDDTLNVTAGMDTTITNPGGNPNAVIVFNTINIFRGGILRIAANTNVQTTDLNIEEGGELIVSGTINTENLNLLDYPPSHYPALIEASGYVSADIMEIEDEVEAEFTGYGGNASYDHNIKMMNIRDAGNELNSILTISHTNSAYSDHDVRFDGDEARFTIIVDGDLLIVNLDLFTSGCNIHTQAGNDVQLQITDSGSLCSAGCSLFRRDIEIVKGGVLENESGRIRLSNNTDSLFAVHNFGRIDLQDDVYLTGNYYDSENDTTYTGGYELYLYENSEMYLRGAELCVGADEEYYPNYDGGKVIQEGKTVIQLEDSGFFHITSIDTLGAGHTPTGGVWEIDAASDKHAKIGGEEVATALQDGDRILIEKKGEINGNIGLYPRRVSYLDIERLDASSAYWQGVEFNSIIDDAIDGEHFEFSNCIFTDLKSFSICSLDSIEVNFNDCYFEDNYRSIYITYRKEINGAVVETSNNVNATVTSCTFYDNYNGILIESAFGPENLNYLHVNSSDFGKLDGQTASQGNSFGIMAIGEESETTIKGCNFYDNEYGMYANHAFCTIGGDGQNETNYFQYNTKPIYMSSVSDSINASTIINNVTQNNDTNGIYCYLNLFEINNNVVSDNLGHGLVAVKSIIDDGQFRENEIENNGSIEIYATSLNIGKLINGGNTISDASYISYPSACKINIWGDYGYQDVYLLASSDTPQDSIEVYGNTIDISDTTRFYPEFSYYDFTEDRSVSSYNNGITAFENGDYETAIAELTDFLEEYPYANGAYTAMTYLYFAEKRANIDMSGYRQFSDIYLPYTQTDTLLYWQDKTLYANSLLEDAEYSEAIDSFQEILEYSPSYDDSLQASIMQGYSYMLLTENGERGTYAECEIETENLGEYCEYLLHCMDTEDEGNNIQPVISDVFNYPNPFNPETKICFELSDPVEALTVTIYNIKGQKVWEHKLEDVERGKQEVIWTGVNRSGRQVASGVYLYRVKAGKGKKSAKMLFLK